MGRWRWPSALQRIYPGLRVEVFVAPHCGDELGRGYPRVWANGEPVAEWYTQTAVFEFMAPFFFFGPRFLRKRIRVFSQVANQDWIFRFVLSDLCTHLYFHVILIFISKLCFLTDLRWAALFL